MDRTLVAKTRPLLGLGLVMCALIAAAVWVLWPSRQEPRARQYRDVSVCLLTDEHGIAREETARVWAGMQDASLKTLGQVRYLQVTGEQSVQNSSTFLGTLLLGNCAEILAAGQLPVDTVVALASRYARQQFAIVATDRPAAANVTVLPDTPPEAVRDAVARHVTRQLGVS